MTLEEFAAKLQEFRATTTDKAAELEEDPKWGTADERIEIIHELEELVVQLESLIETLGEEPHSRAEAEEAS